MGVRGLGVGLMWGAVGLGVGVWLAGLGSGSRFAVFLRWGLCFIVWRFVFGILFLFGGLCLG